MLFVPDKYYTSQTHKYSKHSRCNQEANDKEQYCQLSIGFSASPAHAFDMQKDKRMQHNAVQHNNDFIFFSATV